MPITIQRPKNFDQVMALIDESDWSSGDMMFLIITSLDAIVSTMDADTVRITMEMFVKRYLEKVES